MVKSSGETAVGTLTLGSLLEIKRSSTVLSGNVEFDMVAGSFTVFQLSGTQVAFRKTFTTAF